MLVAGEQTFEVNREELWRLLMDKDVLAEITPGVSDLEFVAEDQYKAITKIKIGPVKAQFKGDLQVQNKQLHESFELVMQQESKVGNAQVKVLMELLTKDEKNTILKFDGKADLSGLLARTGQRVLSGVANSITKQVFSNLNDIINKEK